RKSIVSISELYNPFAAAKKKETLIDAKNVIAFKIDLRIVCKCHGTSFGPVNGEAASHSGDDNIIDDEGKLTREGKDI
ncbi:uncharacterized protein EV154DRAFT_411033, partial [Mucor mucedo]|uniref:uncharacterized protein n=1 Tax=Mucor mucedo TaxID=29922 RepID=UPI0022201BAA